LTEKPRKKRRVSGKIRQNVRKTQKKPNRAHYSLPGFAMLKAERAEVSEAESPKDRSFPEAENPQKLKHP
jgi:hypothetical protein